MITPEKKVCDPFDYESLNKILLGSIAEVKRKELDNDRAESISKLADKVVKNNLTKIMYMRNRNDKSPISFFETESNQILISNVTQNR